MTDSRSEAIQLFNEVRLGRVAPSRPLIDDLRRCQDACTLLGWNEKREWLGYEINGYPKRAPLPRYRKVRGELQWVRWPDPGFVLEVRDSKPKMRPFRERAADVLRLAAHPFFEEAVQLPGWDWAGHRMYIAKPGMDALVHAIRQETFELASESYAVLKYGNALTDVWSGYRREVEQAIAKLGRSGHLQTIERDLRSDNAQDWRTAAYECRSVLEDLADRLWQDPRKTYDLVFVEVKDSGPNEPKKRPIDVSKGRFANRLGAYLHQKAVRDNNRYFVSDQAEYLARSIRTLASWDSEAHKGFSRADVNSVALATYFVLGEVAIKTDLQPVTRYDPPAAS